VSKIKAVIAELATCGYRRVHAVLGFEIGCDNGERVRVAFALDCCDREAMSFLATTGGIAGEDVRDLKVAAVEYSFGQVNRLPTRSNGFLITAAPTSPATPAASPARPGRRAHRIYVRQRPTNRRATIPQTFRLQIRGAFAWVVADKWAFLKTTACSKHRCQTAYI
jgi:hypothetical protein